MLLVCYVASAFSASAKASTDMSSGHYRRATRSVRYLTADPLPCNTCVRISCPAVNHISVFGVSRCIACLCFCPRNVCRLSMSLYSFWGHVLTSQYPDHLGTMMMATPLSPTACLCTKHLPCAMTYGVHLLFVQMQICSTFHLFQHLQLCEQPVHRSGWHCDDGEPNQSVSLPLHKALAMWYDLQNASPHCAVWK